VSATVYLHPRLLARRGAEIAQSQGGRIARDACGRPFVRGADPLTQQGGRPLAEAPAAPTEERGRFEWLLRAIRALARPSMGGRFHRGTP
jgi:hypothetical protein